MFSHKKSSFLQIGIHRQQNHFQFVWFDEQNRPHSLTAFANDPLLKTQLPQAVKPTLVKHNGPLRFVSSISHHLTWTKTLILPHSLSDQECHQQCRFVLEKELPISAEQLWFDFRKKSLKQGFRLDICAIRKEVAASFLEDFSPFKLQVLDVDNYAILRAFRYFIGAEKRLENVLFLFQDEERSIALSERHQQTQLLQSHENLTALFTQFQQRFPEPIEQIFVYQSISSQTDLPADWKCLKTDLPFLALGNALWSQELFYTQQHPKVE